MSFFKKLTKDLEEKFNLGDDKKESKPEKSESKPADDGHEGNRGQSDSYYGGGAPPSQPPYAGHDSYGQQQQHGQPQYSGQQQYGGQPQQYNQPPPGQGYDGGHASYGQQPPPNYGQPQYGQPLHGSQAQPPQPPRWIQQFDQQSQRNYYVETTGKATWDTPFDFHASSGGDRGFGTAAGVAGLGAAGAAAYGASQMSGSGGHGGSHGEHGGFYNQYGGAMSAQGHNDQQHQGDINKKENKDKDKKKDKDNSGRNMLLAGAGGLAVGGLVGAAIAHDSDSDDGHRAAAPSGGNPNFVSPPADPSYAYGTPAAPPPHDSDAESLREAQRDYDEAVRAAADSDASSDELEDLQEAREELEEEREEYYED